ncbi:MAG: TorF family putative porin, partial [Gallionellaceae bacterium]|nr:TorF family putative porin [Gallionellaceae bacterium]
MNKLVTVLALCGLSTLSLPVLAEDGPHSITGNLAFVSDYAFRGISQTDEDPAIQGGFDYAHASGFYLGVWGS